MSDQLGRAGVVPVADRLFTVTELPGEAEVGLLAQLRLKAREAFGPLSFFRDALPVVDALKAAGRHDEAAGLQAQAGQLVLSRSGASTDAAYDFRQTPDGVALELFWRTRATHPEVAREQFRAVVTEANALAVHHLILRALEGKAETRSPSPSG